MSIAVCLFCLFVLLFIKKMDCLYIVIALRCRYDQHEYDVFTEKVQNKLFKLLYLLLYPW